MMNTTSGRLELDGERTMDLWRRRREGCRVRGKETDSEILIVRYRSGIIN
jgi:hypothetical protein